MKYEIQKRGLNRKEAAYRIGVSACTFDKMVKDGKMPPAISIYGRKIWDIKSVDNHFDILSGQKKQKSIWDSLGGK